MATSIRPTVKQLSLLPSVPSYATKSSEPQDAESLKEDEIPIIDFSMLSRRTREQRLQTVQDLRRACQEWGFFMVVNHGVPEGLRTGMLGALEEFFEMTDEEKMKYAKKNLFEPNQSLNTFNSHVEEVGYWRDYLKVIIDNEFNSPDKFPGFRKILQEYVACTRELARELLHGIWESLDLEMSNMDEALDLDSCYQTFTPNLYPLCPQPELALGMLPHCDFGLLTVLLQNDVDGLEVKHNDKWVQIKALPNSFLIVTGDHMEIVSNGRYKSVLHRATSNNKRIRMSVVTAIGPSLETIVVPAPELVTRDDNQARYRGMKFREYLEYHEKNQRKEKSVMDLLRLPSE